MEIIIDQKIKIDTSTKYLRISINENWWPEEFAQLIETISYLYNIQLFFQNIDIIYGDDNFPYYAISKQLIKENQLNIEQLNSLLFNNFIKHHKKVYDSQLLNIISSNFKIKYQLALVKVKYNSPGSIDFFGIGKVLEVVKDFIIDLKRLNFEKEKYRDGAWLREINKRKEIEQLKGLISQNDQRKLEHSLRYNPHMAELRNKRLENINAFLNSAKELKIPQENLAELIKKIDFGYEKLNEFIEMDKLDDIKTITENELNDQP